MKLYIFIDFQTLDQALLLLSNVEFFKKLVSLLDGSESYHQIMVLKLFSYLLSYGGCLDILLGFILRIIQKLYVMNLYHITSCKSHWLFPKAQTQTLDKLLYLVSITS